MKKYFNFVLFFILINCAASAQTAYLNGNYNFVIDSTSVPLIKAGIPLIVDLNKDGNKEIILACTGNSQVTLHVIKSDLTEYPGFPKYFSEAIYDFASGDVDGDGYLDVALKFANSITVIDRFGNNLPGFPVVYTNGVNGLWGIISLYDLDNNGKLEIITSKQDELAVFNYNGQMRNGWPKRTRGVSNYGPAIGDIDGDGFAEILYSSYKNINLPPYNDSGSISIFKQDGSLYSNNWPINFDSSYVTPGASPTLYIDRSNQANSFFIIPSSRTINGITRLSRITKYNFQGTIIASTYQTTDDALGSVEMGDLNNDGQIEFVTGTQQDPFLTLYSNNLTMLPGWPRVGRNEFEWNALIGKLSPSGNMNILSYSLNTQKVFCYDYSGNIMQGFPMQLENSIDGSALSDLNNDGSTELIFSSEYSGKTYLQIFTFQGIPFSSLNDPWPQTGHDRYRSNQFGFVPKDDPIGIHPKSTNVPSAFSLKQNYPNPFNPVTIIEFDVPHLSRIRIVLYDILGRETVKIIDETLKAGEYKVSFDASDYASGIYFYNMVTDNQTITKKMVLLK